MLQFDAVLELTTILKFGIKLLTTSNERPMQGRLARIGQDVNSLSIRRFWGKEERWKRKMERGRPDTQARMSSTMDNLSLSSSGGYF